MFNAILASSRLNGNTSDDNTQLSSVKFKVDSSSICCVTGLFQSNLIIQD